jgi:hypothetical protein
VPLPGTVVLD